MFRYRNEERVGDERDLDRRDGQPGDRHQQLEQGDARDRVEHVGERAERRVEQPPAEADEREQEGDREADADRDQRQLDVLDERRLEDVPQCSRTHSGAEPAVVAYARAPVAEVRDHGPAAVG
jgi:hypothetical protein